MQSERALIRKVKTQRRADSRELQENKRNRTNYRSMASAEQKHATGNGTTANGSASVVDAEQPKDAKDLLPHLESLERIIKLPVVNAAWDKSQDVYGKVKGKCSSGAKVH